MTPSRSTARPWAVELGLAVVPPVGADAALTTAAAGDRLVGPDLDRGAA